MDVLTASAERLEQLPGASATALLGSDPHPEEPGKLDQWLDDMKERAERPGGGEAQFTLGQYFFSIGAYQDALSYFERASKVDSPNNGWSQAKYQLGVMYYDGLGVQEDMKRGFGYMLEVAHSTRKKDSNLVPSAQYNVGRAYFMGFGVGQSDQEAEGWWIKTGQHGNEPSSVRAQNTLGMFYARPETSDSVESFHWHGLAAENGHLESMATLGLLYLRGQGGDGGDESGLKWLKKSAVGGCVYGTGLLAHVYYTRKLFSKAAETAFQVSELKDPSLCDQSSGEGVEPDSDATPLSCLDRRGIAVGCFVLARCLQLGQAVGKNEDKAQQYYSKATTFDKTIVAELHNLLTHGQL